MAVLGLAFAALAAIVRRRSIVARIIAPVVYAGAVFVAILLIHWNTHPCAFD